MFDNEYYLQNRPQHLLLSFLLGAAVGSSTMYYVTQPGLRQRPIICNLNDDAYADVVLLNGHGRPFIFLGKKDGTVQRINESDPKNAAILAKVRALKLDERLEE